MGGLRSTSTVGEPLWGAETDKAIDNFPISGEPVSPRVIHWLGRIKAAAAMVNADLGLLDPELAAVITLAADAVASGRHDDQFPVDVFQTGSGTSSNMNVNEVVSALTSGAAHPNDHVNLGQSSNDVFPSAVQLAVLDAAATGLVPALTALADAFAERADATGPTAVLPSCRRPLRLPGADQRRGCRYRLRRRGPGRPRRSWPPRRPAPAPATRSCAWSLLPEPGA